MTSALDRLTLTFMQIPMTEDRRMELHKLAPRDKELLRRRGGKATVGVMPLASGRAAVHQERRVLARHAVMPRIVRHPERVQFHLPRVGNLRVFQDARVG
jgi:hypothetical protein